MRLDSVRELKLTLIDQILSRGLLAAIPATALAAINLAADAGRQASIAVGISRGGSGRGAAGKFRLAVRIQQRPLTESPIVDLVRKRARGEADIRYIGRVRPAVRSTAPTSRHRGRERPIRIGCSVGHASSTAGTLGAFVMDSHDHGRLAILSNSHVLAAENAGKRGDAILQPGPIDGGRTARDTVARLTKFIRLKPGAVNRIDAAYAHVESGVEVEPSKVRGLGSLRGLAEELEIGDEVAKIGRTTGLTRGRISAIEVDNIMVDYGIGRVRFDDQIEIESRTATRPFSAAGDSGALIVTPGARAAALLFAGSDHGGPGGRTLTYATPIDPVLKELRVALQYG